MVERRTSEREILVLSCLLEQDTVHPKILIIPRKRWLRPNITKRLLNRTLNLNTNKHISPASFLKDMKRNSPRWGATSKTRRPIRSYSICLRELHRKMKLIRKNTPDAQRKENGLIQMIRVGKSIRYICVNAFLWQFSVQFVAADVRFGTDFELFL